MGHLSRKATEIAEGATSGDSIHVNSINECVEGKVRRTYERSHEGESLGILHREHKTNKIKQ